MSPENTIAVQRAATAGELLGRVEPAPVPEPVQSRIGVLPVEARARAEEAAAPGGDAWDALAPRGGYARAGKRALDLVAIALALPLAIAVATPVALANLIAFRDPRRVLFVQPRVGRRGRVFRIYKFRTMSEPRRSTFESWSEGQDAARVTRLGRFLRNAHLDELPQLWNVLRGDMSLVGPRPEMVEVDAWARAEIPEFSDRLAVRPGLTGLSQVTQGYAGRDAGAYRVKLAGDLAYLRRFGLRQDLAILARTVLWVLRGRGWRWSG